MASSLIFRAVAQCFWTFSSVVCDVIRLTALAARSHSALAAENLFLRKHLALFQERKVRPRRANDSARWMMATLSRIFPWRNALVNVKPNTLIGWHRKGFRLFWRWKSKPIGRPRLPKHLRQLIREMASENATWGEERIANELKLKLGIRVSPRTVGKYLQDGGSRREPDPQQRWLTMYEKHRLEWPMAKYFTHPRRIGLIFSITPPTGWEREVPKISLSLPSKAVRFLPFGNSSGIHRPRRLRVRRNSNPRNPKLPLCCRSTLRLFSSFTSTCSLANSSRSRFSTACRSHCWRGCESTKITRSSANLAYSIAAHCSRRVTSFARSSILSTSVRYRLLSNGEITPPCGTPCFPVASSINFRSHKTFSSSTRRATFSNTI